MYLVAWELNLSLNRHTHLCDSKGVIKVVQKKKQVLAILHKIRFYAKSH